MQTIQRAVSDDSSRSHVTDPLERPKIRLFYAGDMDFARPQFASDAPELELAAVSEAAIRDARARDSVPPVDVAFIDCSSPGINAAALVEELRRAFPGLPVVIAVDPGRDDAAREAIKLRADDYTVKSPQWLARLPVRLSIVIKRHRRVLESEALRSEEERLRWIIESAPVCLTRVNREGTVLAINTAGRAMIGVDEGKAVLRKSLLPFIDADNQDTLREFLERVCGGQAGSTEFTIPDGGESTRFVEAHAIPLPPRADKTETALLVMRDITTRRRLEQSLEHVEVVVPGSDRSTAVTELEMRLAEIDEQRRQLTAERDQLAHAVEDGNATVDALGLQLEQRGLELNKLAAERDDLSRRVAATDAAMTTLQAQVGRAHPELGRLTAERDHLLKTIHDIKPAVAVLKHELEKRKVECERLNSDRDALQKALQELQSVHTSELEAARADCGRAEARLQDAETAALESRARLQQQHDELEIQLNDWKSQCHQLELTREALQGTLADLQAAHAGELETAGADRSKTEARLRDAEAAARDAEATARDAEAAAKAVVVEKQALQQLHDALEAQLQELKGECLRVETDRNALQESLRAMQQVHNSELEAARSDCGRAEARLREAEALANEERAQQQVQLTHQQQQLTHQQQRYDELGAQLHEWKGKCHLLESEREEMKATLADLRAQALADRDTCELMELQLQDSDSERRAASAERDRLKRILAEAFAQYQALTDAVSPPKEAR